MEISANNFGIFIQTAKFFDINLCLDCGQAFRWKNRGGIWHGVAGTHVLDIEQTDAGILLHNISLEEFESFWYNYFDLGRDYEAVCCSLSRDERLKAAIDEFCGIRILNQDAWEVLCSFIISQNNNIPRIKGIIGRLCRTFGHDLGNGDFTFPSADRLASLTLEDLSVLRAGFRGKYILDAAQKVACGEVDLKRLPALPIEEARQELLKIKGVGNKVADCALLYGCAHVEAFPIDVWVKRVVGELYGGGLPACINGVEGIAQQYLFHWRRNSKQFQAG